MKQQNLEDISTSAHVAEPEVARDEARRDEAGGDKGVEDDGGRGGRRRGLASRILCPFINPLVDGVPH